MGVDAEVLFEGLELGEEDAVEGFVGGRGFIEADGLSDVFEFIFGVVVFAEEAVDGVFAAGEQKAGEAVGGLGGVLEEADIGEEAGLFCADVFGEILYIVQEKILQGEEDGVLGFVVSGEQEDALFYFGQLFFEVIDMGTLDIVHDEGDGEAIKLSCVENLFFEYPEEGRNKFFICTSLQRTGSISLHDLGIEIAIFRHVLLLLDFYSVITNVG